MATEKQKKAFELIAKNNNNVGKTMLEAGYKPSVAKKPKILTGSKGWDELREEHLPRETLALVHKAQLSAERVVVIDKIVEMYPDNDARLKALDMAYKIWRLYPAEQVEITKRKYQDMSNAELAAHIKRLKDFILKK